MSISNWDESDKSSVVLCVSSAWLGVNISQRKRRHHGDSQREKSLQTKV